MNRRGNGLSADSYDRLIDLAPHLADVLLTALGDAGVAAYVTSPGSPDGPELTKIGPGDDILDRLYVDADMKPTAEGILHAHLTRLHDLRADPSDPSDRAEPAQPVDLADQADPGDAAGEAPSGDPVDGAAPGGPAAGEAPGGRGSGDTGTAERDEDAIWADIVASFDDSPDGDAKPWPEEENLDEPPAEGEDRTGALPHARVIKSADPAAAGAAEAVGGDDDEGHFIPPPPPPLPTADPLTKGAWIALIGGPVYLLITVILNWDVPGWAAFLAVAAFIGGFVTLVLRMGDEPRGPDDGAVV